MNKTITFLSLTIAALLITLNSTAQFGCQVSIDFDVTFIEMEADAGTCSVAVSWTEPTIEEIECEGVTVTVSSTHTSGDTFDVGTHDVTYTAVDGMGNQVGIGNFVVEVFDIELPELDGDLLEDDYLECGVEEFDIDDLDVPTATDNCSGTINGVGTSEFLMEENGYQVEWTFTDASGNILTESQFIGFEDSLAPEPDAESLADVMSESDVTELDAPTATDACSEVTVTNDAVFPITMGTTTVTWTYTDEAGNSSTQTQNVIVGTDSIEDIEANFEVSIYPNPSNGEVTIAIDTFDAANNEVRIYNSVGQTVYANILTQNTSLVNLEELRAGIYIVEINREGAVKRERLIIE